jgi:hypothetical protein
MNTKITFEYNGEYLLAKIDGKWESSELLPGLFRIKEEADKHKTLLILMDAINLSYPINDMTRFHTGEKISQIFRHQYKISAFTAFTVNYYTETVALNRGTRFRIFPSKEEAILWLLGDKY